MNPRWTVPRPWRDALLYPALLLPFAGCSSPGTPPPAGPDSLSYQVSFRGPPADLEVEVAVKGPAPSRWYFSDGIGWVQSLQVTSAAGSKRTVEVQGDGEVTIPPGTRRLRYTYPLEVAARGWSLRHGAGQGSTYVVAGAAYLIRPARLPAESRVELNMETPAGSTPLLPWRNQGGGPVVLRGAEWHRNLGFHGFGGRRHMLEVGGGSIEVRILDGELGCEDRVLVEWIRRAASELLTMRTGFPSKRSTVTLVPLTGRADSSPFGQVLWSNPPSIAIYVGGNARPPAFERDWVAVHEMLHLCHPRFSPRVNWLSEGIATYYQCVVRMRSGRLSPEEAWGDLAEGVKAGRRESGDQPLAELSRRMHALHLYRAVYWGGALLMLELDIELRRMTGGRTSLDDVVAGLLATGDWSSLKAFGASVDAVAGSPIFGELARLHLTGPALAEGDRILASLGIEWDRGEARLREAPLSTLRADISRPD